jgi:hypothetical protein
MSYLKSIGNYIVPTDCMVLVLLYNFYFVPCIIHTIALKLANKLTVLRLLLVEHSNKSACKLCVLVSRPAHSSTSVHAKQTISGF